MEQPLLTNEGLTESKKSPWKCALGGVAVASAIAVCCSGTQNEIQPENFMQNDEETQLEPAEPLELDAISRVNNYVRITQKVVDIANSPSGFDSFADIVTVLSVMGPECALIGGVISLGEAIFGGPSKPKGPKGPTQSQLNAKKLDEVVADLHKISNDLFRDYKSLRSEGEYHTCFTVLDVSKNYIMAAMRSINAMQPKNRHYEAITKSECLRHTRNIIENVQGGQCGYFNLVKNGNPNIDMWPNNPQFMKQEYAAYLLVINQGLICSASYQSALMRSFGAWEANPQKDLEHYMKGLGLYSGLKDAGTLASDNMKNALVLPDQDERNYMTQKLQLLVNDHLFMDGFQVSFYEQLQINRPQHGWVILASYGGFNTAQAYTDLVKNYFVYDHSGQNFLELFAVPKKEWVGFSYSAKSLARDRSQQYGTYLDTSPIFSLLKQANAQYWGPPTGRKGPYQAIVASNYKKVWAYGVDIETGKPGMCQPATCVGVFYTPAHTTNRYTTFYMEMYYYPVF